MEDINYIGNYEDIDKMREKWLKFPRREDVMDHLKNNDYLFVVKIPNLQPILNTLDSIFPNIRFTHIVRNGNFRRNYLRAIILYLILIYNEKCCSNVDKGIFLIAKKYNKNNYGEHLKKI